MLGIFPSDLHHSREEQLLSEQIYWREHVEEPKPECGDEEKQTAMPDTTNKICPRARFIRSTGLRLWSWQQCKINLDQLPGLERVLRLKRLLDIRHIIN